MTAEKYNRAQMDAGLLTDRMITELVCEYQHAHELKVDGYCGPATQKILADNLEWDGSSQSEVSKLMLEIALSERGNGEEGGNNSGPHVAKYLGIVDDGDPDDDGSWCAAFVSWCGTQASLQLGYGECVFKTSNGAKKLAENIIAVGERVSFPAPGDIVWWDRGKPGSWEGHIGIVWKIEKGVLYTVEGNVGRFPAVVDDFKYDMDRMPRLEGFARLLA